MPGVCEVLRPMWMVNQRSEFSQALSQTTEAFYLFKTKEHNPQPKEHT